MHKLKENNRVFQKEQPDLQVYIETGINSQKEAVLHSDQLSIAAENKIQNGIKNQQYQHNGKDTIILKKSDIGTQQTRRVFNNDKTVSTQVLLK